MLSPEPLDETVVGRNYYYYILLETYLVIITVNVCNRHSFTAQSCLELENRKVTTI